VTEEAGKQQSQIQQPVPLAIVGIGSIFPQAGDTASFWTNIKTGVDAITEVPETHWRADDYYDADPKAADKVYAKMGGFLSPVEFNPMDYGILPNAVEAIDTSQLLGLLAVEQALKDAGYTAEREFDRDQVSVILGVTGTLELVLPLGARLSHPQWREALKDAGVDEELSADIMQRLSDSYVPWQENSFPGLLGNVVAGRISKHFDFGGTNCTVDAACGSSLSAINLAALELTSGRSDMAISGGVDTFNDVFMYTCFSKTPALSPSGHARPFSADTDGTTLGEGLGIVVLKRLADAERDGDKIYAVIKAIGTSSDGSGSAIYEPSADGQTKALKRAYRQAGIKPESIELMEGHGTGTKVGDAIEVSSLHQVFGTAQKPWCALGSVKSQIGHTKAAAGVAGVIKTALALYYKTLPQTIKADRPLESLLAPTSAFYLNNKTRPWIARSDEPRRAGVSALGFGGSNFHCLLEEYQSQKQAVDWSGSVQILPFSWDAEAQPTAALTELGQLKDWTALRRFAAQQRSGFDSSANQRLIAVVEQENFIASKLAARVATLLQQNSGKQQWDSPEGVYYGSGSNAGELVLLFPGQGAQYPDMLRDLALQFPEFLEQLERNDSQFAQMTGVKRGEFFDLIYPPPRFDEQQKNDDSDNLRRTENAQPALGTVSIAALQVLKRFGVQAQAAAGHSYGELAALCSAGVIDEQQLFELSRVRGEAMAAGSGDQGSMIAVFAPLEQLESFVAGSGLKLVLANRNTPTQGVLSGATKEIEKAERLLGERSIRFTRLSVSAAFHSELVAAATGPLAKKLSELNFSAPELKVYSNTTGVQYPEGEANAKPLLAQQLANPVNFVAEIENLHRQGARTFVEVGPRAILSGMVNAILGDRDHAALALDSSSGKRSGIVDLGRFLAQLAVIGHSLKLDAWDADFAATPLPKASKIPALQMQLTGANYFKKKEKRPALPKRTLQVEHKQPAKMIAEHKPAPVAAPAAQNLQQALQVTQQSLSSLQNLQAQTAQLHQQFLEGQQTATQTFMRLIEQQSAMLQGEVAPMATSSVVAQPSQNVATPAPTQPPAPVRVPVLAAKPVVTAPEAAAPATNAIAATLLSVVADKTGYPLEMLELDMALDSDLGIDSIKRVEILSSLQEALPDLPAVKPEDLGVLQTLGQIVEHLSAHAPVAAAAAVAASGVAPPAIAATLLSVVADKTGYPLEMLELDMALDSDLGIDSIKRVEILSSLQEALPDLPAVKPEDLGVLQTLGQIVEHLQQNDPAGQQEQIASPLADVDADRLATVLLAVIADKTGYPPEMLELDMALDSDLGIDSIKRVEILSSLQEQLPALPPIKPDQLGSLQTVRQIVDYLGNARSGEPVSANSPAVVAEVAAATGSAQIQRQILQLRPLPQHRPQWNFHPVAGREVWITDDGSALAEALCTRFTKRQLIPRRVTMAQLEQLPPERQVAGLVVLAPLKGTSDLFLKNAFLLFKHVAVSLNHAVTDSGAFFVTVSRLNGGFGLATKDPIKDPVSGGLAGLTKTASHEFPKLHCKAFDLAPELEIEAMAEAIVEEIFSQSPLEVGISSLGRQSLELTTVPLIEDDAAMPVNSGDLVVVSGGGRGVTAEAAIALAVRTQATLLLLGRSPEPKPEPTWLSTLSTESEIKKGVLQHATAPLKPIEVEREYRSVSANREIVATLERIRATGAQALYRSVDLRDSGAVKALIDAVVVEFGAVKGLIHGAGVLADKLIREKTAAQFEQVYSTKIAGFRSLYAAIDPSQLKFMVMFSSSTGRFGRIGQVDYAVANEVLNKLADQQAALYPQCRVISPNWGPWDGGMVNAALKEVFASEGIEVIDIEAGTDYLCREIATAAGGPVELVILGGGEQPRREEQPENDNLYTSKAFDLELNVARFPFLKSHIIDGKAVLPLAMMIEWMAHAAVHNNPGLKFQGFDRLRVLKGVILAADADYPLQLLTGKSVKIDGVLQVPVEIAGFDDRGRKTAHARCDILLGGRLPEAPAPAAALPLAVYSQGNASLYRDKRLFHGRDFQGIHSVNGCAAEGISAAAVGAPAPSKWMEQPLRGSWLADPLLLDSSFQMLILWSFEEYQSGSLPVFAGRYRQYRAFSSAEEVEIRVRITERSSTSAKARIEFIAADGSLLARLDDYECVIDASLNAPFSRNRLIGVA
jgi:acyl transferase domain-containing protein/NAD(P)-dependent dehydrogenase (short-subunit alcohol dehydrogenase family)